MEFSPGWYRRDVYKFRDLLVECFPAKRKRKVTVAEARKLLVQEEANKLVDMDQVVAEAIEQAEKTG